jgi:hypothetical protein
MAAQTTYPAGEGEPLVSADEPPVVLARGLVKRYGEIVAVDQVDLAVPVPASATRLRVIIPGGGISKS